LFSKDRSNFTAKTALRAIFQARFLSLTHFRCSQITFGNFFHFDFEAGEVGLRLDWLSSFAQKGGAFH
jgi:hypothetical protein